MIDKIENEIFVDFNNLFNKHTPHDLHGMPLLLLKDIFNFIADNAEIAAVFIGNQGNNTFLNKIKAIVKDRIVQNLLELYNKPGKKQNIEFFVSFVVAGCLALVEDWLKNGMKESPEEMAALAENIIIHGVNVIK